MKMQWAIQIRVVSACTHKLVVSAASKLQNHTFMVVECVSCDTHRAELVVEVSAIRT